MKTNHSSPTISVSEKVNTTSPKAVIILHTLKILQGITKFNFP